ncbi:MAG: hypothetical protein NZU63_10435 [Gemmataceae bacterium]|nr:hypothetical protein [Gemmataceae bacterium]MDW8242033.1 hypothetical protein [Thermogemmata sp.]
MTNGHRHWLVAGVAGGVCGAVMALLVNRWLPPSTSAVGPAPSAAPAEPAVDSEARQLVERCLSHIKNNRLEELTQEARASRAVVTDEDLQKFLTRLRNDRELALRNFGKPLGEYELLRATVASASLVQFVYLERFERGAIWWMFVLYRTPERWQLAWLDWGGQLAVLFAGLP